jgi:hypothetical protein
MQLNDIMINFIKKKQHIYKYVYIFINIYIYISVKKENNLN